MAPQAQTVPSERSASTKSPAAIWVTPVSPVTGTGVLLAAVVPSPRSPLAFPPQVQTVPSDRKATLTFDPAETATMPLRLGT